MDEDRQEYKKRCEAMIAEDIYDPESKEGIDFCVEQCPYSYCIVMEGKKSIRQLRTEKNAYIVKRLRKYKVSLDDIALILHTNRQTVQRWLKK